MYIMYVLVKLTRAEHGPVNNVSYPLHFLVEMKEEKFCLHFSKL